MRKGFAPMSYKDCFVCMVFFCGYFSAYLSVAHQRHCSTLVLAFHIGAVIYAVLGAKVCRYFDWREQDEIKKERRRAAQVRTEEDPIDVEFVTL